MRNVFREAQLAYATVLALTYVIVHFFLLSQRGRRTSVDDDEVYIKRNRERHKKTSVSLVGCSVEKYPVEISYRLCF